jgi:hypothetical protein
LSIKANNSFTNGVCSSGENVAKVELPTAMLILGGWLEKSTSLLVVAELIGVSVRGRFSVSELTSNGVLLESLDGGPELSIALSGSETALWYFEPREFSSREEYKEAYDKSFGSAPEAELQRSSIGIKFSIREGVSGLLDALIPAGKVVLVELPED